MWNFFFISSLYLQSCFHFGFSNFLELATSFLYKHILESEKYDFCEQSVDESTWKRNSRHQDDPSLGSSSSSDDCQECESKLGLFYKENKSVINGIFSAILLAIFLAYFVVACYLDFDRARDLFIVTMISMFFFLYYKIKGYCGDWTYRSICLPMATCVQKRWTILRWYGVFFALLTNRIWEEIIAGECVPSSYPNFAVRVPGFPFGKVCN